MYAMENLGSIGGQRFKPFVETVCEDNGLKHLSLILRNPLARRRHYAGCGGTESSLRVNQISSERKHTSCNASRSDYYLTRKCTRNKNDPEGKESKGINWTVESLLVKWVGWNGSSCNMSSPAPR